MPRLRSLAILLTVLSLAAPSSALALAGGSTGGGSSGGGGFSGGSSSSSSSFSSSSGSSSSSTGTGGGGGIVAVVIVLAVFGGFFVLLVAGTIVFARHAQTAGAPGGAGAAYGGRMVGNPFARRRRAQAVEIAARTADDGYWDPDELKRRVYDCFYPIQWSWEKRDVDSSRAFVSDSLYERHRLQLEGLEKQHRRNRIADLALHEVELIRMHNVTDDSEDRFVAYIGCSARDWVEDVRTGQVVNGNATAPTYFQQYWSFARHPEHGWVLDEIQQASEAEYHETAPIVDDDTGPPANEPVARSSRSEPPKPGADVDLPAGEPPAKPANWYPDPWRAAKWRWWDGANWTGQTSA